ncbi:hypothetical protein NPIL_148851 [Nephila pilipes]|uniref:Protein kinase domain-containing protein n=1 Tax=Nephila pilipes TaxID=299642 RepID=A0A8X6Q046_NEPPI|nr:hypothetical protein NPIL_148851 [Nephila pilipes]
MQKFSKVILPFLEEEKYDYTCIFENFNFSIHKKVHQQLENEKNSEQIKECRAQDQFEIKETMQLQSGTILHKAIDVKNNQIVSLAIYRDVEEPENEKNDDINEMVFLPKLKHQNILKFCDVVVGSDIEILAFSFESHHSLLSTVIDERVDLLYEAHVIKNIMHQLFKGLDYLHRKSVIHRDIHPDNILFTSTGVLKIWNLRNARWMNQRKGEVKTFEYRYQPIELILEFETCTTAVDIWSAGCIFAQLLQKKILFPMYERESVLSQIFALLGFPTQKIYKELYAYELLIDLLKYLGHHYNCLDIHMKNNCPEACTVPVLNLLHSCLLYNPKDRLTADQCLHHEYFYTGPAACPPEDIVKILEASNINKNLRQFKNKKAL